MAMNSSLQTKNPNLTEYNNHDDASVESSWSAYLNDFPCSDNSSSPSLVSDASWHGSTQMKRLRFKKSKNSNRTKHSRDRDLEDTASSPKVSTLEQMEVNYNYNYNYNYNHPRIDGAASHNFLGNQVETAENNGKNAVDLRQRGLCVVPMSEFVNYFG